jgi:hypothetical protein
MYIPFDHKKIIIDEKFNAGGQLGDRFIEMPDKCCCLLAFISPALYICPLLKKHTNQMRPLEIVILCLISTAMLCSCAARYRAINPSAISYPKLEGDSTFTYKYNVLRQAGNRKLAKKENKQNVRIVAIKLTNNTGHTLKYGQNCKIYSGSSEAFLLDPLAANKVIKQTVPTYLLYLLLTPMRLNIDNGDDHKSYPIGYVIGPAITAGNVAVAATANKRFRQELINHDVLHREINNGETFYGLIAIRDNGFMPLTLKLIK